MRIKDLFESDNRTNAPGMFNVDHLVDRTPDDQYKRKTKKVDRKLRKNTQEYVNRIKATAKHK